MIDLTNYIAGAWQHGGNGSSQDVINPATGEVLGRVHLSTAGEVDRAARAAKAASLQWRQTPVTERVQPLFKLKALLESHVDELSRIITMECGKTLAEARGELQRAIENVEVACGTPILMQGYNSEDIAHGINEIMIRQPIGVAAIIAPFNFPGMIPFWFLPYAVACGNACVVKPSERVPLTMHRVFELLEQCGLPPGVINLVNGSREAVDALLDHPDISSVSFVGSTPVARYVYERAAAQGKRAQCSGGAKNPVIILPDADLETTTRIVADSAFGCAGQRCLAASLTITVGEAEKVFTEALHDVATSRVVGYGLQEGVEMGPVISSRSKSRIEQLVAEGVSEGGELLVDGRNAKIDGFEAGYFVRPTLMKLTDPDAKLAGTEVFGPVLGLLHVKTVDDAIALINRGQYGNMACLFTSSGASARKFRHEAEAGNVGINIGVAAPMAFFPFSGWKQSFFGDLHAQGRDAVQFFTREKVVVERWPRDWSRKF